MGSGRLYQSIDLANCGKRTGYCVIEDDGGALTVESLGANSGHEAASFVKRAIDCHFGYTYAHTQLLRGAPPPIGMSSASKFALWRETENWFADKYFRTFKTTGIWNEAKPLIKGEYFNKGSHIVPACGMRVIPNCLATIFRSFGHDCTDKERCCRLIKALRGDEVIVEAHPRLFLYSLLEKIHRKTSLTVAELELAARYKQKKASKEHNRNRRVALSDLLVSKLNLVLGRRLQVPSIGLLAESDHNFDALLAALTAWAFDNGHTVTWTEAGIDSTVVDVEGHISVLRLS